MSKYQIMPPLSDEQYEALKADIATAGVRVPIEVDENGEVIDGHHRRAIAMELGIECPETVIRGLAEFEKLDRAFVLNATRRHFNRDQQRAVIVKSLMLHPRLADREHARRCGVSHPTVADVRRALEAAGRLESFTSRVSGDGRERPARNEPTRAPRDASGLGSTSPVDESGTDHQDGKPGEAEDDVSSAADVNAPSAPTTTPEESPASDASGVVDEPERAGAGVSSSAPAPTREAPEWLVAITRVGEAAELLDGQQPEDVTDPDLFDVVRHARETLTDWEDRAEKPDRNRRPLPDAFHAAAMDLQKVAIRLHRLVNDDRFPRNAEQVARISRGDLLRTVELLSSLIDRIPESQ